MSWRTNHRTHKVFKLPGPAEFEAKIRSDLRLIGREDRYEQLNHALHEQIAKAHADYAKSGHEDTVEEASELLWEQVAGGGPSGLRSSKPKDGRAAYVWRMLRFHTGADMHLPITADWDLSNDIDREVGYSYREMGFDHPLRETAQEELRREKTRLDAVIEYISATQYPTDQFRAALRWQGLLY